MAISKGHIPFTGRVGDVVYYYVGNEIWCRTIFPNQRTRVMKEERYALFRVYSGFFRQSSKIASLIYRTLGIKKDDKFYRSIVGEAMKLFKNTPMKGEEVLDTLWKKYVEPVCEPTVTVTTATSETVQPTQRNNPASPVSKQTITVRSIKKPRFTKGDSLFKTFSKTTKDHHRLSRKKKKKEKSVVHNTKFKNAGEAILQLEQLQSKMVNIDIKWKGNAFIDVDEEMKIFSRQSYVNEHIY